MTAEELARARQMIEYRKSRKRLTPVRFAVYEKAIQGIEWRDAEIKRLNQKINEMRETWT